MDISPDSTPTSEPSYSSPTASNNQHTSSSNNNNNNSLNHDDVMTSPNGHATKHPLNATNSSSSLHHQVSNASTSSILSSSSKLNSAALVANSNKNSTTTSSSSPSTHNYSSYHHHHHRHRSVSPNDINNVASGKDGDGIVLNSLHHNSNSLRSSPTNAVNSTSVSRLELNNSSSNSNHLLGDGPPTPEMDLNSGSEHRRREYCFLMALKLTKIYLCLHFS
jgi:hypothetical protein